MGTSSHGWGFGKVANWVRSYKLWNGELNGGTYGDGSLGGARQGVRVRMQVSFLESIRALRESIEGVLPA